MSIEKKEAFIKYLDERTSAVQDNIARLIEDNRRDEADFEKIRANIFPIMKQMHQVSERICQDEGEQMKFLDARITVFEETWKGALAKATEHKDEKRILQEQVKLEAIGEIRDAFEKIWEVKA